MKFISLKKRIENALTPRMEPKGYGDNPEELQEINYGSFYVSVNELVKLIKMRKCTSVGIATQNNGYTEEAIENNQVYRDWFLSSVTVTKKQAKQLADNYIRQSSYKDEPMLLQVTVYTSYRQDGSFRLSI